MILAPIQLFCLAEQADMIPLDNIPQFLSLNIERRDIAHLEKFLSNIAHKPSSSIGRSSANSQFLTRSEVGDLM